MDFSIKSDKKENIGILTVKGDVDMFTSPSLREELVPFFTKQIKGIIVDLSDVPFMDSSGIATLVEGLQWSMKNGKKFILTGLGINVLNALTLTKLESVFNIQPDRDEAYQELCES